MSISGMLALVSGLSAGAAVLTGLDLLSYAAAVLALAAAAFSFIAAARTAKNQDSLARRIAEAQQETRSLRKLADDIRPALRFLAEEDAALVSAVSADRKPVAYPAPAATPWEEVRLFADAFVLPQDDTFARLQALQALDATAGTLQEASLRLPFIDAILKRVVSHTETAAMTLIDRFSFISEQTAKSDQDAKNAIAALGLEKNTDTGLETLIRKSHESVVGRTAVINDFLRLNRDNADRVKKISALVARSEELLSGIEDITERSKLIAFNMAVESAKIGEKGLGFKVIVNELQRLNDQTTSFARDIMEIVKSFKSYNQELLDQWLVKAEHLTEQVREDSDQAESAVSALKRTYELTGSILKSLTDSAINVNRSMSDILSSLQFQDITRQQIEGAASFLADIEISVNALRKDLENLGYAAGDVQSALSAIRTRHEAQLKVSKDHDIFGIMERRFV
jgi:methyl-accepting chemotaxis protein